MEDDSDAIDRIRRQTSATLRAWFVAQLKNLLGRLLRPAKRGRKPKRTKEDGGEAGNS